MVFIGMGIGAVVIAFDEFLKARQARFRVPVLAAAIGIYLPLELMVPIFLGGLLAHLVERRLGVVGADHDTLDRVHRPGVLFSAGLITGEALMGIFIAIPIYVKQDPAVLALPLPEALHSSQWLGLLLVAGVAVLLFRTASHKPA